MNSSDASQTLPPATIADEQLAPPPPAPLPPDGLVLASIAGAPVVVFVPWPPSALVGDTVQLLLDGNLVGQARPLSEQDQNNGVAPAFVAAADRPHETTYALGYDVHYVLGNTHERGATTPLTVDVTPPGRTYLAALEVDPDIVARGLDAETLAQLGDKLPALAAGYEGEAPGDTLVGYIDTQPGTAPVQVPAVPGELVLEFTGDALRAAGDGLRVLQYRVTDRAGNVSALSRPQGLVLALGSNPLPAPTLDQASGAVLELVGAQAGATARIKYPDMAQGETVTLTWAQGQGDDEWSNSLPVQVPGDLLATVPFTVLYAQLDRPAVPLQYRLSLQPYPDRPSLVQHIIVRNTVDAPLPRVLKAYGPDGDRLNFDDIYYDDFLTVEVPHYPGMLAPHAVQVSWAGNVRYDSQERTVGTPGAMQFDIPRLEVVDVIGRTATLNYTVRTRPGAVLIDSASLLLHVDPQAIDLPAPTIDAAHTQATVTYPGIAPPHSVRLRWTGVRTHDSADVDVRTGQTEVGFAIPPEWVTDNAGGMVLVNYTVLRRQAGERLQFSRLLRLQL